MSKLGEVSCSTDGLLSIVQNVYNCLLICACFSFPSLARNVFLAIQDCTFFFAMRSSVDKTPIT